MWKNATNVALPIPASSARATTPRPDAPRVQQATAGSQLVEAGDEAGRPQGTHTGHTCSQGHYIAELEDYVISSSYAISSGYEFWYNVVE